MSSPGREYWEEGMAAHPFRHRDTHRAGGQPFKSPSRKRRLPSGSRRLAAR